MTDRCTGQPTFRDIEIEEITVEGSLNTTGNNGNPVIKVLHIESVDPIDYVEATIKTKGKQVVGGDGLSFTRLGDHVQLGHDCNTLQVDRECPQDLQ